MSRFMSCYMVPQVGVQVKVYWSTPEYSSTMVPGTRPKSFLFVKKSVFKVQQNLYQEKS